MDTVSWTPFAPGPMQILALLGVGVFVLGRRLRLAEPTAFGVAVTTMALTGALTWWSINQWGV